jgi:hypothetical protein
MVNDGASKDPAEEMEQDNEIREEVNTPSMLSSQDTGTGTNRSYGFCSC